jgi:hypothetical protein
MLLLMSPIAANIPLLQRPILILLPLLLLLALLWPMFLAIGLLSDYDYRMDNIFTIGPFP